MQWEYCYSISNKGSEGKHGDIVFKLNKQHSFKVEHVENYAIDLKTCYIVIVIKHSLMRRLCTHREIFSKYYSIKPKLDCIYHAPIDLERNVRSLGSKSIRKL